MLAAYTRINEPVAFWKARDEWRQAGGQGERLQQACVERF